MAGGSWRTLARTAARCDLGWAGGPGAVQLCCALWLPASRYRPARSRLQGESWELADEEGYNGVREGEVRGEERRGQCVAGWLAAHVPVRAPDLVLCFS